MRWPTRCRWPRWAALAYAMFGLCIFGLSTIQPIRDDGGDNFTYTTIMYYSYPCASHDPCPLKINIPFETASQLMLRTPLDSFVNMHYDSLVIQFWFTKTYSPIAPWAWLFIILYGCLFYYVLTWLVVKAMTLKRHKK